MIEFLEKVRPNKEIFRLVQRVKVTDPDVLAGVVDGVTPEEWAVAYSNGSIS